jgi:radical SAM superfamily enzyme YgiQ (UPF0313 family)
MWNREKQWGVFHRGAGNNNFSYGLASLAGYLEEKGIDVSVCDPQFFEDGEIGLTHFLQQGSFDLVGITTYTPTVLEVYATARVVRHALPHAKIVFGGPHATLFPQECLQECSDCDYIIVGEGEEVMWELLDHLKGDRELQSIGSMAYRSGDEIVVTERRGFLDVEQLPQPAYHLHDPTQYQLQPTAYHRLPTITLLASRGCPYQCTFCDAYEVHGRKVRCKSVDQIIAEMDYLKTRFHARGFMFQDSTFTMNKAWVEEFCKKLIARKWSTTWGCYTRADRVDFGLLQLMKKAGCWGISFGVESANQKSLDLIQKGMTLEQNTQSIQMAIKQGFYVTATYMLGLPGEDVEDVERTISYARKMGTHIAHFFLPLPYPKTKFYDQCVADGGIDRNAVWAEYSMLNMANPVYVNPRIGAEKMQALKWKAIKKYYLSPRVVLRNILSIRGFDDIKRYKDAVLAISGVWL